MYIRSSCTCNWLARRLCFRGPLDDKLVTVILGLLRSILMTFLMAVFALSFATGVRADDAQDLETGRKLFESAEWKKAIDFFQTAIEGDRPTLKDPTLVPKARMYWAASAFNLGLKDDADKQIETILRADPKFEPDPIVFSAGVLDEFHIVQERIVRGDVRSQEILRLQQEVRILQSTKKKQEDEIKTLLPLAREEWVVEKRSRVLASLPFGIGQFQNGDTAFGIIFLSTETIALVAATWSYIALNDLAGKQFFTKSETDKASQAATTDRIINWISLGTFFGVAIGGIVQAHVAFVPETRVKRNRTLPDSIAIQPFASPTQQGCVLGLAGTF